MKKHYIVDVETSERNGAQFSVFESRRFGNLDDALAYFGGVDLEYLYAKARRTCRTFDETTIWLKSVYSYAVDEFGEQIGDAEPEDFYAEYGAAEWEAAEKERG